MLAERIGYHPERGRLDETHHPFCTRFSIDDVRITTRVYEHDIGQALFSTIHEAGHAFYEQGVDAALDGTPLGHGVSAGVHESQSRLWENQVARSRGFWQHFYPQLQRAFPDALAAVELDTFYRAINRVERSLIRTDADEVTYNLHIMLRFELELDLLEGRLRVIDLPEAWREGMRSRLGLVPADDRDGCLQDVHWYWRHDRRRLPELHHRQHSCRAVLRRCAARPSRDSCGDRERKFRHAARLAARAYLPARAQISAQRADRARHRLSDAAWRRIWIICARNTGRSIG